MDARSSNYIPIAVLEVRNRKKKKRKIDISRPFPGYWPLSDLFSVALLQSSTYHLPNIICIEVEENHNLCCDFVSPNRCAKEQLGTGVVGWHLLHFLVYLHDFVAAS